MGVLAFVFLDFVIAPIKQQGYSQIKHMLAEYFLSPTNGALLGPNCGVDFKVRCDYLNLMGVTATAKFAAL